MQPLPQPLALLLPLVTPDSISQSMGEGQEQRQGRTGCSPLMVPPVQLHGHWRSPLHPV